MAHVYFVVKVEGNKCWSGETRKGIRKMFGGGCPTNNMDDCDPKWASWMVRRIRRLKGSFKFCV